METKVKQQHIGNYKRNPVNNDWICSCMCGATWTQDKSKTQEDLIDLHLRHIRIFEKRIEVL